MSSRSRKRHRHRHRNAGEEEHSYCDENYDENYVENSSTDARREFAEDYDDYEGYEDYNEEHHEEHKEERDQGSQTDEPSQRSDSSCSKTNCCRKCKRLSKRIGKLQETHDDMEKQMSELKNRLHAEKAGYDAAATRLRVRYESEVYQLHNDLDGLREEIEHMQGTIDDLELARANLEINNDELFRNLHSKNTQIVELQRALSNGTSAHYDNSHDHDHDHDHDSAAMREEAHRASCVVCKSACIDTVFVSCNHAACCETCVRALFDFAEEDPRMARCPVCRRPFAGSLSHASSSRPTSEHHQVYRKIVIATSS